MSKIKVPRPLKMEDLGHTTIHKETGFCASYTKKDLMANDYQKYCGLLGYEIDRDAAVKIIIKLTEFLSNCADSKYDYLKDAT